VFPEGADITPENIRKASSKGLDTLWLRDFVTYTLQDAEGSREFVDRFLVDRDRLWIASVTLHEEVDQGRSIPKQAYAELLSRYINEGLERISKQADISPALREALRLQASKSFQQQMDSLLTPTPTVN
jgi:hypothetical protein